MASTAFRRRSRSSGVRRYTVMPSRTACFWTAGPRCGTAATGRTARPGRTISGCLFLNSSAASMAFMPPGSTSWRTGPATGRSRGGGLGPAGGPPGGGGAGFPEDSPPSAPGVPAALRAGAEPDRVSLGLPEDESSGQPCGIGCRRTCRGGAQSRQIPSAPRGPAQVLYSPQSSFFTPEAGYYLYSIQ